MMCPRGHPSMWRFAAGLALTVLCLPLRAGTLVLLGPALQQPSSRPRRRSVSDPPTVQPCIQQPSNLPTFQPSNSCRVAIFQPFDLHSRPTFLPSNLLSFALEQWAGRPCMCTWLHAAALLARVLCRYLSVQGSVTSASLLAMPLTRRLLFCSALCVLASVATQSSLCRPTASRSRSTPTCAPATGLSRCSSQFSSLCWGGVLVVVCVRRPRIGNL